MKNNAYNSFVFHGSYYERLQVFDREIRLRFYEAIIEFSLAGIEPDFEKDSEVYRVWLWIRNEVKENNKFGLLFR